MDTISEQAKSLFERGGDIKFGKGVIGKSSSVLATTLLVFAIVALRIDKSNWIPLLSVAALAMLGVLVWHFRSVRFAEEHPDAALLEGAQWLQWQKMEAAATKLSGIPQSTQVKDLLPPVPEPPKLPPPPSAPEEKVAE